MALSLPSANAGYVPSHKASGGLMFGFSRNEKGFAINQYLQIIPVQKQIFYTATWNSREAARVRNADLRDHLWPDGMPAPKGVDQLESFGFVDYRCERYIFPYTIGDLAVEQADFNILQAHADVAASKFMVGRTAKAYSVWGDATKWGTHCANVNGSSGALNGNAALLAAAQDWTNGTRTSPNFKKCLNRAFIKINQDTLATLKPGDLTVVMNPNTAAKVSESPEMYEYMGNSQYALAMQRGGEPGMNDVWGLPDRYNGVKIAVDDTPIVSSNKPGTSVAYLIPDGEALVTSRKGGLEGVGGAPAYSTLALLYYKDDMTVESFHNTNDRLTEARIVTNFTIILTTPSSGYYFKAAVS